MPEAILNLYSRLSVKVTFLVVLALDFLHRQPSTKLTDNQANSLTVARNNTVQNIINKLKIESETAGETEKPCPPA